VKVNEEVWSCFHKKLELHCHQNIYPIFYPYATPFPWPAQVFL